MTSALQRYCRQLPATKQLRRMELTQCLKLLGLRPHKRIDGHNYFRVYKLNEWELKDLFESAHALYRRLMAKLHPDAGGSQDFCSRLTELWARIKVLFKRKGVEV